MSTTKDPSLSYDPTAIREKLRIELEQKLKAQKRMRRLMEMVLFTIFTVTIAIVSVSDGNLESRPLTVSETQIPHTNTDAVRVTSNQIRPMIRN
ncbi:MAG: hypothetical protein KDI43_13410 [Gammaproteobacteria bacterium]|nr:hypothetical protein [Gammaproteobacteria bacterium]